MSQNTEEAIVQTLPFSAAKQEAIVGWVMLDAHFWEQAKWVIKPTWFTDPRSASLFEAILNYNTRVGKRPTESELRDSQELLNMGQAQRTRLHTHLTKCLHQTTAYSLADITPELEDWLHARIYHVETQRSAKLFNSAPKSANPHAVYAQAFHVLREMNRQIMEISFEQGKAEQFNNPQSEFAGQEVEISNALTFGHAVIDKALLPESDRGSLLRGDTTILLAPTNTGKTTCMITVICANINADKDVLFITHEGRPQDIKMKIWQCMTGLSRMELFEAMRNPKMQPHIGAVAKALQDHLVYIPLNRAGLTVEEFEAVVRREQDKWRTTHNNKGFDLMVDDYMANMTTQQARGGQFQRRHIDEIVYNYGVQFALEYGWHFLTAIQTNREGSRVNRKEKGENRLVSMEDVLESWGVMTKATNVISINRDERAKAEERVTFYICKSRSSETGFAIACRSKYAASQTHHFSRKATVYRSTTNLSKRMDSILETHGTTRGGSGAVPQDEVDRAEREEWDKKTWG